MARRGEAWRGRVWSSEAGKARRRMAGTVGVEQGRAGVAWRGKAWLGQAGMERRGKAWRG